MKKKNIIWLSAILIVVSIIVVSCNKGSDNSGSGSTSLVGTSWRCNIEYDNYYYVLNFISDNTGKLIEFEPYYSGSETSNFTYTMNGTNSGFIIIQDYYYGNRAFEYSISGNMLYLYIEDYGYYDTETLVFIKQ